MVVKRGPLAGGFPASGAGTSIDTPQHACPGKPGTSMWTGATGLPGTAAIGAYITPPRPHFAQVFPGTESVGGIPESVAQSTHTGHACAEVSTGETPASGSPGA